MGQLIVNLWIEPNQTFLADTARVNVCVIAGAQHHASTCAELRGRAGGGWVVGVPPKNGGGQAYRGPYADRIFKNFLNERLLLQHG